MKYKPLVLGDGSSGHPRPASPPGPGQSPTSESTLPQERLAQQREVVSADQQDLRRETGRYP